MGYLHTETHSWHQQCPVLQCWDMAHRTAGPLCPGMSQEDTGHTAPAPRYRTSPHHSSLRRTAQVSALKELLFVAPISLPLYEIQKRHKSKLQPAKLTTFSFTEDLPCAAGFSTLWYPGRFLSNLVLCPRELNVELLFVD